MAFRKRIFRKSRRSNTLRKAKTNTLAKKIKTIALKASEPKHFVYSGSFSPSNNAFNFYNITYNIPNSGTSSYAREGDKIHLDAIKFNFEFYNGTSNVNTHMVRLLLIKTKQYYTSTWGAFSSPTITSTGTDVSDSLIDTKMCTVVFDKHFEVQPSIYNGTIVNQVRKRIGGVIRLDTDFYYKSTTAEASKYNYYWVVGVCAPGTAAGTCIMTHDLIFKDM